MLGYINQRLNHIDARVSYRFKKWRWLALLLSLLTVLGDFFCYDNPQALHTYILQDLKISDIQYNAFYSIYASPNILMPFVGGVLIDKLGIRSSIMIFSTIITTGQFTLAYYASHLQYKGMLLGRLIYSVGGDSLVIGISVLISKWFANKSTTFALSVVFGTQSLCLALNSLITPLLYNGNLAHPLYVGGVICACSLVFGILLCILDAKEDQLNYDPIEKSQDVGEGFHWKDIGQMRGIFWLLLFTCAFIFSAYYGFTNVVNNYLTQRFEFSPRQSGRLWGFTLLTAAFLTPLLGKAADRCGFRAVMISASTLLLGLSHLAFYLESNCDECRFASLPLIGMTLFVGFFFSVIWSCLPLVMDLKYLGTAYGLFYVMRGLMLTGVPIAVGYVEEQNQSKIAYKDVSLLLAVCAMVGFVLSLGVNWLDHRNIKLLNHIKDLSRYDSFALSMTQKLSDHDSGIERESL